MINRLLIRIKTTQLVYAYMQGSLDRLNSDDQLANSLESGYKLYNYMLALVVKITDYRQQQINAGLSKFLPTAEDRRPNTRFADNRIAKMLRERSTVIDYCEEHGLLSDFDTEMYRSLLDQIMLTDTYRQFMAQATPPTLAQEKELWREIFQQVINNNTLLDSTLEERNLYWNDDVTTITEFVIKTINRIQENADQVELEKMYTSDDDFRFASQLFHHAMDEAYEYEALIGQHAQNWQVDRIALMDKVIMICALAEIRNFFEIPVRISMNEYIELAKHYGTKESGRFVNGILDKIVKQWKADGIITKN